MNTDDDAGRLPRKEREALRQRGEILAAAEAVFAGKGYVSACMEDVARQAEFGMGTLYKFFRSKADLYGSILLDKSARFLPPLEAILKAPAAPAERIRRYFFKWLDLFWEDRPFFRLFFQNALAAIWDEKAGFTPEVSARRERLLRRLERVYAQGVKVGEFWPLGPSLHAEMLEGVLRAYLVRLSQAGLERRLVGEETSVWEFYERAAMRKSSGRRA